MKAGQKFGRLTAIKFMYRVGKKRFWQFRCDCGKILTLYINKVTNGTNLSCGCLQTDARRAIKGNEIEVHDNFIVIIIKRQEKAYRCLIDKEDYFKVKNYTWFLSKGKKQYAISFFTENGVQKNLFMHRLIMDCPDDKVVDHINITETLDNRKSNLRVVTQLQNMQNCIKSKYEQTGIHYREDKNKWTATIGVNGKLKHIGSYDSYEEAVLARKEAEKKYWQ